MRLMLLRSLWTNGFALDAALADVSGGLFDGIEGPVPRDSRDRREFIRRLRDADVPFVAEIVTGDGYVPRYRSGERHLDDFRRGIEAAAEAAPLFATVLAGCDAWPLAQSVAFFSRALEISAQVGVEVCFETHRSRPTFTPWSTLEILREVPTLRLTCDFSHWCCVCERLVLDEEPELLATIARRARHIHARVGYEQGPQVPHPAAPEHRRELEAHERWWQAIASERARADDRRFTLTPEFGPDGYLHAAPFSQRPAANLDEVNRWMAARLRERFATWMPPAILAAP